MAGCVVGTSIFTVHLTCVCTMSLLVRTLEIILVNIRVHLYQENTGSKHTTIGLPVAVYS